MAYQTESSGAATAAYESLKTELDTESLRLETIETRLGTSLEQSGDFEIAREIAHRIRNIQTLLKFRLAAGRC